MPGWAARRKRFDRSRMGTDRPLYAHVSSARQAPFGLDVNPADIQDRDGAARVIKAIRTLYPWLRHLFADGGYPGPQLKRHLSKIGNWTIQIIKRSDKASGFELLPRRWVVKRTFAWLGRCRRLSKDFKASLQSAAARVLLAHIRLLTRKIARQ